MKKLHVLLAAAAVLAVAAGIGYAAIPSSNGTISACKDNKGVLKVIDAEAGQSCPNNQQPLTWNQQGPAGPQGPAGISGYERVYVQATVPAGSTKGASALCSAGKRPLGGGTNVGQLGLIVTTDRPTDFGLGYGWQGVAFNNGTIDRTLEVYAICATVD